MIKKMLVNATHPEENRVAIVEDGILSELDIEIAGKEQTKGNIYNATVIRVEQGLQAAFVDYGAERLGFLQMGEIHPGLFPKVDGEEPKGRPRVTEVLHRGQELLVQVTKEERGNKGAALTTFLSLPGRYMVLMPGDKTRGMSRKIPDGAERKQLKESISHFVLPDEMGYIIRTAAIGQSPDELTRDLQYLLRVYNNILELNRKVKEPALIYRESNLMIRSIRDYFTPDMDEVLVDDPAVFKEARDFFQQVMPEYAKLVKLHQERRPVFSKYQIEDQIETIAQKQVFMPGGGSIVIDSTEALVAIDVNSGKMASEQGVEGTAYKTNLEAADEVARQLRLRDLGGLVVIDFIDMRDRKHIREVEKRLKVALKSDKARVSVGRISQFGLLEMSRQRIKATLAEGAYLSCPNCEGTGRVRSVEAQAVAFLRKLHAAVARGQLEKVESEVPLAVSHYLLNNKREELVDMERRYQTIISIRGRKSFIADQTELTLTKREKEEKKPQDVNAPVTATTALAELPDEPKIEAGNTETSEDKPQKRSRNRRRNRKSNRSEQPDSDAATAAEPTAADSEAVEAALDTATEAEAPAAEEAPAEKRPSRRRRGRRSKKTETPATTTPDAPAETPEPLPGGTADERSSENPSETPAPVETEAAANNRRPRRTRKPKTVEDTPSEVTAVPAQPLQTERAQKTAPEANHAEPDASDDKPPARRRRSRRVKKPESTEITAAEIATPEAQPPAVQKTKASTQPQPPTAEPATDNQKLSPRKRTRKPKSAPPEDIAASTDSTDQTEAAVSPQLSELEAPAKPKRKRAPRKPAADKTNPSPAENIMDSAPSGTEQQSETQNKPATKPKVRKSPAKASKTVSEVAESAPVSPKKPASTRRKKVTETESEPTPDKPKRQTRRKKTAKEPAPPATESPE